MNQKALELEPTSLDAKFGIAMVYFNQRRLAEAKRGIEEILKENSEFYPGHIRLGMIAELSQDLEGALKHYRRAAELKPYDEDPGCFSREFIASATTSCRLEAAPQGDRDHFTKARGES